PTLPAGRSEFLIASSLRQEIRPRRSLASREPDHDRPSPKPSSNRRVREAPSAARNRLRRGRRQPDRSSPLPPLPLSSKVRGGFRHRTSRASDAIVAQALS